MLERNFQTSPNIDYLRAFDPAARAGVLPHVTFSRQGASPVPPPETGETDTLAREWVEKLPCYGRTSIFQKSLKRIKINIKAETAGSYSAGKEADGTKFCAEKLDSVFLLTFSEK